MSQECLRSVGGEYEECFSRVAGPAGDGAVPSVEDRSAGEAVTRAENQPNLSARLGRGRGAPQLGK